MTTSRHLALMMAALLATTSTTITAQGAVAPVERTAAGHLVGDPEAPVSLIEFISYTCPHCGDFAKQADNALTFAYAGSGEVRVEYRPMVRDPVDLTVTMLVGCVEPKRFSAAHAAFMERQDGWLNTARRAPAAQQALWRDAYQSAERRRSIASTLDLYPAMEPLGLSRTAANRCLADQARVDALLAAAEANRAEFGVPGTPSFALDGILLAGTHDWATLQPQLDVRLNEAD